MPTRLPDRETLPPKRPDRSLQSLVIAATLLLSVLVLICERNFAPLAGYALAPSPQDLQLSP